MLVILLFAESNHANPDLPRRRSHSTRKKELHSDPISLPQFSLMYSYLSIKDLCYSGVNIKPISPLGEPCDGCRAKTRILSLEIICSAVRGWGKEFHMARSY